jgi:DNA-binding CsgD family transcriptional regulator
MVERGTERLTLRQVRSDSQSLIVLARQDLAPSPAPLEALGLSRRESQVRAWIAQGKTCRDIARGMTISQRTVQKLLERIFAKLGVRNRTQAAAKALAFLQ